MLEFPTLLFQKNDILTKEDCQPHNIDPMRIIYNTALQAFRLEVACYPHGMSIRSLFVRHDKQGCGIGSSIVWTLKEISIQREYDTIELETVLESGKSFWIKHDFVMTEYGGYWKTKS